MGFGRIGRDVYRVASRSKELRIGAISDIADHEALTYLLRYDSIRGRFPDEIVYRDGYVYHWGREIPFLDGRDPGDVDWSEHGVDYVIEATGKPRSKSEYVKHLDKGAERVLLCAPPLDPPDISVVYGVNDDQLAPAHRVISNGSNTAHCAAPVLKTIHESFGIERAHLTATHAYTSMQRLGDVPGGDLRNSRAAAENIMPSETNASDVLMEVLPELRGRVHSSSLRVPVPNGALVDITMWLSKAATAERINETVRTAASGPFAGILEFSTDPLVSSDVENARHSSIFDSLLTMMQHESLAKVMVWSDSSWGYIHRLVDLIRKVARMDGKLEGGEA
jgi:glyceraldehyde 3-phosphate dehydrogenase